MPYLTCPHTYLSLVNEGRGDPGVNVIATSIQPLLPHGINLVCKTKSKGAGDWQVLDIRDLIATYQTIAMQMSTGAHVFFAIPCLCFK